MSEVIDNKERKIALDPRKSLLIQAPAGSGKTELLIQRYLRLLSGVEHPDQIISMTFTRKAAEEMKRRILEALKRGLSQASPESPHQQQTWELAKLALVSCFLLYLGNAKSVELFASTIRLAAHNALPTRGILRSLLAVLRLRHGCLIRFI